VRKTGFLEITVYKIIKVIRGQSHLKREVVNSLPFVATFSTYMAGAPVLECGRMLIEQ
jgi:hypothetical protein